MNTTLVNIKRRIIFKTSVTLSENFTLQTIQHGPQVITCPSNRIFFSCPTLKS